MNHRTKAVMAENFGLITRSQAVRTGMQSDQIDRLVRRGSWTVVRRGVYAETSYVDSLASFRDQRLLLDRAASMRIRAPHVMSHDSAAFVMELPILHPRPPITHVTRPGVVGSHLRWGVKHHLAPFAADQVITIAGTQVLEPARTALDIAREHGYLPGIVAAESALRHGVPKARLAAAARLMKHWPYVSVVHDVISSASADTDSIGETLLKELVIELGFGVPWVQFGLTSDGRIAWCDLLLGRHAFEFDGRIKLLPVHEGGVVQGDPSDALWREKTRQDWVCGFKLGMSRVVWDQLFGAERERTKMRLRREYLDTCRRFGTDISDLLPYRPRVPRKRPPLPRLAVAA